MVATPISLSICRVEKAGLHPLISARSNRFLRRGLPDQPQLSSKSQLHIPGKVVQHRYYPMAGQLLPEQKLVYISEKHIAVALALHGQAGSTEGLALGG